MCIRLINILNNLQFCKFYTNNSNLSKYRMVNRFNGSDYSLFKLLNDICGCLLRFNSSTTGTTYGSNNLSNLLLKKGNRDAYTKNNGIDLFMLQDGVIKTIMKTMYHLSENERPTKIHRTNAWLPTKNELRIIKEWIYLYLYGRVAMDLSIIINILYSDGNSKTDSKKILYNKLSFVDLDLKSIRNIYKYKHN